MNVVKNMKGRLTTLSKKELGPWLRVAAFSCRAPCVCDGFEVCVHRRHGCVTGPLWPVFNAQTEQEAREIQTKLVRLMSSVDPSADEKHLMAMLRAWALAGGWEETHHIVWRKPEQIRTPEMCEERDYAV